MDQPGRRPDLALEELLGPVRSSMSSCGDSTLRATMRFMVWCCGLEDPAHAARPSWSRMRYWPSTKPLVRPASSSSAWNLVSRPLLDQGPGQHPAAVGVRQLGPRPPPAAPALTSPLWRRWPGRSAGRHSGGMGGPCHRRVLSASHVRTPLRANVRMRSGIGIPYPIIRRHRHVACVRFGCVHSGVRPIQGHPVRSYTPPGGGTDSRKNDLRRKILCRLSVRKRLN